MMRMSPTSKTLNLEPKLRLEEVVPYIELPSSLGEDIDLWRYKQRKNLVIVFYHGSKCPICQKKIEKLAEIYNEAQKLDAEILAISFDDIKDVKDAAKVVLPFPLLSDAKKSATLKFTYIDEERRLPLPSMFITDRFGALYYQKIAQEADELPDGKEVLSWLFAIQCQCPECSIY